MRNWLAIAALLVPLSLAGCGHSRTVVVYAAPPPPAEFNDVARQGYHDGWEAARHDVKHGDAPDVEAHPKFRRPHVPPTAIEDYRHGFREGYQAFLHRGAPPTGH
jgi:hypothetical protein